MEWRWRLGHRLANWQIDVGATNPLPVSPSPAMTGAAAAGAAPGGRMAAEGGSRGGDWVAGRVGTGEGQPDPRSGRTTQI